MTTTAIQLLEFVIPTTATANATALMMLWNRKSVWCLCKPVLFVCVMMLAFVLVLAGVMVLASQVPQLNFQ